MGNGWDAAPGYTKGGELGRHGQEGQEGTAKGCDRQGRDEVLGRWGIITPPAATGLWKAHSSPLGELVAPGVSCTVPREGAVNQTRSRSRLILTI